MSQYDENGDDDDRVDEEDPLDREEDQGCIGADCLCPHIDHVRAECFTEEMAKAWHEGNDAVQPVNVAKCVVCRKRPNDGVLHLCSVCAVSYHRVMRQDDTTALTIVQWAARRAWWYALGRGSGRGDK